MAEQYRKKKENDWGDWGIIAICFLVGIWPVALFLLFFKLFGNDRKENEKAPLLSPENKSVKRTSQQKAPRKTAKKVMRSPAAKSSTAKWLKIAGILVAVVGVLAMAEPLGAIFYSSDWLRLWLEDLLAALSMGVAGIAMFCSGASMDRSLKRYAKYLAVMGDREAMPVEELARTLGYSRRRVEKDLQKMLDKGYFGGKAYLNMELGYLFRSSNADVEWKQRQAEKAAFAPKEAEEGYSGILRNIRRANDRIADPILSAKIDRLEEITAKIFREVEAHPEKQNRIATFLTYYLPTTQKLLDSYAEFESAGVEGENLRQAKGRIEATMDSIIRGFEHQLYELYHADAMDVASDIKVMETMLRRDAASVEEDFGLGTAAAQEEESF